MENDLRKDKVIKRQHIICLVFLIFCLLVCTATILFTFSVVLGFSNKNIVFVQTSDLEPTIKAGNFITYKESREVEVGDLCLFTNNGYYCLGFLQGLSTEGEVPYYTFRDNESSYTTKSIYYVGVYDRTLVGLTNYVSFCNSLLGKILMIGIPLLAYITFEVFIKVQKYKQKNALKENQTQEVSTKKDDAVIEDIKPRKTKVKENDVITSKLKSSKHPTKNDNNLNQKSQPKKPLHNKTTTNTKTQNATKKINVDKKSTNPKPKTQNKKNNAKVGDVNKLNKKSTKDTK